MKSLFAAVALAAALLAPAAYADCTYPQAPSQLPDGNTATLAQMLAAQKAVSSYNQEMTAYLSCIELERDSRVATQAGAQLTPQQKQQIQAIEIQKHNAAVDQLHAVADQFNAQVRIFKARDKKSDD
jgi:opacity protein-like surface antigen